MTKREATIVTYIRAHEMAVMSYDDISEMLTDIMFDRYPASKCTGNLHFEFHGFITHSKQAVILAWLEDDSND